MSSGAIVLLLLVEPSDPQAIAWILVYYCLGQLVTHKLLQVWQHHSGSYCVHQPVRVRMLLTQPRISNSHEGCIKAKSKRTGGTFWGVHGFLMARKPPLVILENVVSLDDGKEAGLTNADQVVDLARRPNI